MKVRSCLPLMLISFGVLAVTAQVPSAPKNLRIGGASGIAARYPGDAGIENDPDVLFAESFEEATTAALFARWTDIKNGSHLSFSSDVPPGSSGSKSLNIDWVGGASDGGHLFRPLSPGVDDTVYVRYYIKHPSSSQYTHSGIWIGGHNPSVPWPDPQAGIKPVGNDRFSAAAEQTHTTARFDHYDYWMDMRNGPDGNFWGNFLLNDPSVQGQFDAWTCVEQMVKLNNPVTSSNGEHAIWRDGVKISHVGSGFPNGSWLGGIFTQDPAGTPFGGLRWRSDAALNLNWIWLQAYAPADTAGVARSMKFDHVVVAKTYVGCLAGSASDITAPTVTITAPAAGATVSGSTVTVSMTAADDVGVAGVQFRLDGANSGAEDTTPPYTILWNTTTASNGSHALTAVARDAAGNRTTSASKTVTVSNAAPPPSSSWPNEPAGWRVLSDWGFDQVPPQGGDLSIPGSPGWKVVYNGGGVQRTTDSTAPASPSSVYDFIYPQGMVEGGAPATVYYNMSGGRQVYLAFWWKPSSPFDTGLGGNKIVFLFNGGGTGGGQQFLILQPSGLIELLPEYPKEGALRWRRANVNPTVVTLGVWHRIEWYSDVTSGVDKWWLDGTLQGSYTDVTNSYNFDTVVISPTWGGNTGAQKKETDHYWFDHVRISVP